MSSVNVRIVNTVDENGNGYVSDFDIAVDVTSQSNNASIPKNGKPYFIVSINGDKIGQTGTLDLTTNKVYTISLPQSTFEPYKRGQLRVTVTLAVGDDTIKSWTKTVNYEPE